MAYGNLRRAGIAHLIFGILSLIVGISLVAVTFSGGSSGNITSFLVYIGYFASPLYCSIWPIIAGAVGACANEERSNSITCIKVCVIVFSIFATLAAAVQLGLCAFYGWLSIGAFSGSNATAIAIGALTWAGALLGLLTFITAIVHASIGCCCTEGSNRNEAYQMK